jgi:hypothetical protein
MPAAAGGVVKGAGGAELAADCVCVCVRRELEQRFHRWPKDVATARSAARCEECSNTKRRWGRACTASQCSGDEVWKPRS